MFICSVALDIHPIEIASIDRLILALSILFFFCFSLWNALSRRLDHLLLLSGAITAILFAVILDPLWSFSWVFYALFLFIGFMVPFLTRKQTPSLPPLSIILYQVLLNLFMIGEMTYLGKNLWFSSSTVSLITLGLVFFGLSVASLVYSLMLIRSSTTVSLDQIASVPEEQKNMMYGILAIPLSLFSLSIAVIFSDNPSIVAAVWILESAIFAFLSSKVSNIRILIASSILLLIGLLRLIPFFDMIQL